MDEAFALIGSATILELLWFKELMDSLPASTIISPFPTLGANPLKQLLGSPYSKFSDFWIRSELPSRQILNLDCTELKPRAI